MKPVLQSLIIARLITELKDGGNLIVGIFNTIAIAPGPPGGAENSNVLTGGEHGPPYAYISLTDVLDGTELSLQFVSLTRNVVIFEQEITIACNDRLATIEVVAALPHLRVAESGMYAFEVVCEGEIIGSSRLRAMVQNETDAEE